VKRKFVRRWTPSIVVVMAITLVCAISASTASASTYTYQAGGSCCSTRQYSGLRVYQTQNSAGVNTSATVCVQEQVFPSGGSSFFDQYKCGAGGVSHDLNGNNIDRALCWTDGSAQQYLGCTEMYN
jgi:hypothetical protein